MVQCPRERCPKPCQVSTTIPLGNVVGVAEDVFCKRITPLHGHFDFHPIFPLRIEVENRVENGLVLVEVINKGFQTTFVMEQLLFAATLIHQANGYTRVEEGELTQAFRQNIVVEFDVGKRRRRRAKMHAGTAFFRFSYDA